MKMITNLFLTNAYASPGSGHSHGPEAGTGTQMVGVGIIVIIVIVVFYFMSKKNNSISGHALFMVGFFKNIHV